MKEADEELDSDDNNNSISIFSIRISSIRVFCFTLASAWSSQVMGILMVMWVCSFRRVRWVWL